MIRRIGTLAAVAVAASALAVTPAMAQDSETSDAPATTVRIQARKVESGKVEFGLQLDGQREWLPRARLFPYPTASVGQWLFASPYTMSDGTIVRIQAQLLANGRIEFGLQLNSDQTWLPRARFFPYDTADVGTWLFSSPFSVGTDTGVFVGGDAGVPSGAPAGTPRNLRVAAVICDARSGLHSVRLEWDPPADAGGATSYEVTRLRAPNRTSNLVIVDPGSDALVTGTSHVDSDVRRNELYEWSVRPRNATADATARVQLIFSPSWVTEDDPWGSRQRNDCDETATSPAGATEPGPPQDLRARHDRARDRIVVTWSLPADDGGARITSYQIGRSRADASRPASWWTSEVRREPHSATFDLQGATAGTFRFWVRAVNSAGVGPWTSVEYILTAAADASGTRAAPRNLRVAAVICDIVGGLHSVRLEWDPPAGASGATSYEVTRLRAPNRTSNLIITDPGSDALVTDTSHVDSDVRRNELYEWSVQPRNATVDATASVQLIFKPSWVTEDDLWGSRQRDCDETVTPPTGATEPGVPQNLRARHDPTGDRIVVTWSLPADDGGARITSYQVGRTRADASGPASRWTLGVSREPSRATFDLHGATAGAFRFWVRAINGAGVGPWTSVEFKL